MLPLAKARSSRSHVSPRICAAGKPFILEGVGDDWPARRWADPSLLGARGRRPRARVHDLGRRVRQRARRGGDDGGRRAVPARRAAPTPPATVRLYPMRGRSPRGRRCRPTSRCCRSRALCRVGRGEPGARPRRRRLEVGVRRRGKHGFAARRLQHDFGVAVCAAGRRSGAGPRAGLRRAARHQRRAAPRSAAAAVVTAATTRRRCRCPTFGPTCSGSRGCSGVYAGVQRAGDVLQPRRVAPTRCNNAFTVSLTHNYVDASNPAPSCRRRALLTSELCRWRARSAPKSQDAAEIARRRVEGERVRGAAPRAAHPRERRRRRRGDRRRCPPRAVDAAEARELLAAARAARRWVRRGRLRRRREGAVRG